MTNISNIRKLGVGFSAEVNPFDPIYDRVERLENSHSFDYFGFSVGYNQSKHFREVYTPLLTRFPLLFHPVDLSICNSEPLDPSIITGIQNIVQLSETPWITTDMAVWRVEGENLNASIIPTMLTKEAVTVVADRIREIGDSINVPFLPENPPFWFSLGDLHILDFMAQVSDQADCYLCLDLGHLLSYQICHGLVPDAGLANFPLDRVVEVHVAGGVLWKNQTEEAYEDAHFAPIMPQTLDLLRLVLNRTSNLKAITLEAEGLAPEIIAGTLSQLRDISAPILYTQ